MDNEVTNNEQPEDAQRPTHERLVMRLRRADPFWLGGSLTAFILGLIIFGNADFWWISPLFIWCSWEYWKISDCA
jgi:hypothetical protein